MNKITTLLLAVLLTTGCSDFLTQLPDNAVLEKKAITSLNDMNDAVIGVYSNFKSPALYSGYISLLPDLQADLFYAVDGYTNTLGHIYRWEIISTTTEIERVYADLYMIVARANFVFDYADQVAKNIKTTAEKNVYNTRLGDIHFARALAYSELIRLYCDAYDKTKPKESQLGVSISTTYIKKDQKELRQTLDSSYHFVLKDLDMAEQYVIRDGADAPFFTQAAINALRARVCLYMQDWENAVKYATVVIENNLYELDDATLVNSQGASQYTNLWRYDTGKEIIWKIAMSNLDRGGALGVRFLGFNSEKYYPDYIPAKWVLDLYSEKDMRAKTFFGLAATGHASGLECFMFIKYLGNPEIDQDGPRLFTNMPKVFRLSEQYLIRAEANAMLKNESAANADLSALRQKRIINYGVSSASGEQLIKEIRDERVRELIGEGFRLSDLKRWGKGFTRKPQDGTVTGPDRIKIDKTRPEFTWPIPQHEMEAVPGMQGNASNGLK